MSLEYICKCNKCDALLYDENPKEGAIQLETSKLPTEYLYMEEFCDEDSDYFWGCPNCEDDGNLSDLDYFEYSYALPEDLRTLVEKYSKDGLTYAECESLHKEAKEIGYTFEWSLDAVPYDLKKI